LINWKLELEGMKCASKRKFKIFFILFLCKRAKVIITYWPVSITSY